MVPSSMFDPNIVVLVTYLVAVAGLGAWFARRRGSTEEFISAGGALPGWAIGLSMFGSYVSSISFVLAPGKAYATDWSAYVFTLATPIAAIVAVRWFVPFFRHAGAVSAYEHFEHQFGPWARTYAVICFLLTQMARMGAIVYPLGLVVSPVTGWPLAPTILLIGVLMIACAIGGGIKAAVWIGAFQSFVLVAGTAACLLTLILKTPGGFLEILEVGSTYDKFSLGSFSPSLSDPTIWVLFAYGLVMNLGNFATDQSYVQRYITARSEAEAKKSVWITTALYVPTAAVFFFMGSGLFVFYRSQPELLGDVNQADYVLPHFIVTQLPYGLAGLVVAAIFAASMDSNLSSMATLTLCDLYKRYFRPQAGERESLLVLRISTVVWGAAGTGVGLWMIQEGSGLDKWWDLAGLFSGGVLGLFLLGLISRSAGPRAGLVAVVTGVVAIVWMTLPKLWPGMPESLRSPLNSNLTVVVGTLTIFLVGLCLTKLFRFLGKDSRHMS